MLPEFFHSDQGLAITLIALLYRTGSNKMTAGCKKPRKNFREVLECGSPLPLFHRTLSAEKVAEDGRTP